MGKKIDNIATRIGTLTKMSNRRKRVIIRLLAILNDGSYKRNHIVDNLLYTYGFTLASDVPTARRQLRAELYELGLVQHDCKLRIKKLQAEVQTLLQEQITA